MEQFSVLVYLNSIVHSNRKTMDYNDANLPHLQVVGFHCLWLVLHWCIQEVSWIWNMRKIWDTKFSLLTTVMCCRATNYTVGCVNSGWVATSLRRYLTGTVLLLGRRCEVSWDGVVPVVTEVTVCRWTNINDARWCQIRPVFSPMARQPLVVQVLHCRGFTITLGHTTLVKNPLDEWSARRRNFFLPANTEHSKRQTAMPTVGFEHVIPAIELSQTHALDRSGTGFG